jgi:thioredoxin
MKYFHSFLLVLVCMSCRSQQGATSLIPKSFQEKLEATADAVVMDVRTPGEFSNGYIDKAVNIDYNDRYFKTRVLDMDKQKTYFVYCLSGGRSGAAASFMRTNGFSKVYELEGGMMAWNKAGLAVVNDAAPSKDKYSMDQYKALTASADKVLIDFYAPWCGPCRQMLPILEEMSKKYEGKASIIRINIDENKKLTNELGIDEIPYFKLYQKGEEKGNFIGQLDKATFDRILQ